MQGADGRSAQPPDRPHLLVGGVGAGKTAVLVRLTEFLAAGAVPVPIRLRTPETELALRTWRGTDS